MAASYHHGVEVIEINEGLRTIQTVSTAVIGVVCTASDADAEYFPLNKAKLITNVTAAIGKAGKKGTLAHTLTAIADQCSPVVIVVRVAEGTTVDETTKNIIGGSDNKGQYTGMQALLSAKIQLGVTPRILAVPGLDTIAVTNALITVAQKLRAFCYVSAFGAKTKEEAQKYRNQLGAREAMVIWPDFVGYDIQKGKNGEVLLATARAAGLRAKIDQETGWHKTLSNVPVNGVAGLSSDVFWDLQDKATDSNYLNENKVTTLICNSGYRFWGSRTCAADPLFAFENYTRTAQILRDTIADAMFWAMDKPIHATLVKDIIESINAKFRELKTNGYIIDANAYFDPESNTEDILKSGKLYIDYDYTPVPPLEHLVFRQRITDRYLVQLAESVEFV